MDDKIKQRINETLAQAPMGLRSVRRRNQLTTWSNAYIEDVGELINELIRLEKENRDLRTTHSPPMQYPYVPHDPLRSRPPEHGHLVIGESGEIVGGLPLDLLRDQKSQDAEDIHGTGDEE